MFDGVKDKLSGFTEKVDETGVTKKAASAAVGKRVVDTEKMSAVFRELELQLISADVHREVAEEIVEKTRERVDGETVGMTTSPSDHVEEALTESVRDVLSVNLVNFEEVVEQSQGPVSFLFTGINGVGKTTTIAKLSERFQNCGFSTVIANGDTYRAAADEQIRAHANAVGAPLINHEDGGDPAAVVYDAMEYAKANGVDVVLADTAGRLHTDNGLMEQLEKIHRVSEPTYTVFVDEATAGQDAIRRASGFSSIIETDAAILTKSDATTDGGAVVSIPHATGLPLAYIGTGESYSDLERLEPKNFVTRLFEEE